MIGAVVFGCIRQERIALSESMKPFVCILKRFNPKKSRLLPNGCTLFLKPIERFLTHTKYELRP